MTVNAERGEVALVLGGEEYVLLPTAAAVNAIEAQLGSLLALCDKATDPTRSLTLHELAVITTETMRAAKKDRGDMAAVSLDKVSEMLYAEGMVKIMQSDVFPRLVVGMINGGVAPKKTSGEAPATSSA